MGAQFKGSVQQSGSAPKEEPSESILNQKLAAKTKELTESPSEN